MFASRPGCQRLVLRLGKPFKNEIADGPYEVVVLSIGGNDWQGFRGGPTEKKCGMAREISVAN